MPHVKAVCLDLDDTLWDTAPVIVRAEAAVYAWLDAYYPRITRLYTAHDVRCIREQVALDYPDNLHDLSFLRQKTFTRIARTAGYSVSLADQALRVFQRVRNDVTLYEDVLPALQGIADINPVYALTNGNADLSVIGLAKYFRGIFLARELGVAKPDPRIFELFARRTGLGLEQILHVGDNPANDIDAARAVGMPTVWVNRKACTWPLEFAPPDCEVSDLRVLLDVLQQ
jgi:HAD superfamily hydrolase (TIGR01549 family)